MVEQARDLVVAAGAWDRNLSRGRFRWRSRGPWSANSMRARPSCSLASKIRALVGPVSFPPRIGRVLESKQAHDNITQRRLYGAAFGGAREWSRAAADSGARRVGSSGRSGRSTPLRASIGRRGAARENLQCLAVGATSPTGPGGCRARSLRSDAFGVSLGGSWWGRRPRWLRCAGFDVPVSIRFFAFCSVSS